MGWKRLLDTDDQPLLWHTTVSSAYSVGADIDLVFVSSTATVSLPDAADWSGRAIHVKSAAGGAVVTVDTAGGNIDGLSSKELAEYGSLVAVSDGTDWWVI